ncbi:MAG: YcxB family protein [Oscillospiraceae bacterium]
MAEEKLENKSDNAVEEQKTDLEVETNENNFERGLSSDDFDLEPDFKTEFEEIVESKNKKGISINYSFNGKEISDAIKIFQKETIYKRNIIYTALFSIVLVLYVINAISNPNVMSVFLSVLCVALIGFIWYNPYSHRIKSAKAVEQKQKELNFNMEIFDDSVKIIEKNGSFVLKYGKEITKIIETSSLFLLCVGKERVFVIPKRFLTDNIIEIKKVFKNAMQEKFVFKNVSK